MMGTLVIFTRAPQLGRVKTRLAGGVGALTAVRFHRAMLARLTVALAGDGRWRTRFAVTPDAAAPGWPGAAVAQGGGDLGARMGRAFKTMPPGPVVIVGTDVPALRPDHVARAFKALGRHQAVLGPAADGGFWLIGLAARSRLRPPFGGVRWSGPRTLADTRANLAGRPVALLETLADIDDGADFARWRRLAKAGPGVAH